jgi:hypothetical protein
LREQGDRSSHPALFFSILLDINGDTRPQKNKLKGDRRQSQRTRDGSRITLRLGSVAIRSGLYALSRHIIRLIVGNPDPVVKPVNEVYHPFHYLALPQGHDERDFGSEEKKFSKSAVRSSVTLASN